MYALTARSTEDDNDMYAEVSCVVCVSYIFLACRTDSRRVACKRQDSTYRISGAHELADIDGDLSLAEGIIVRHVGCICI
jgi:hypothetical protein